MSGKVLLTREKQTFFDLLTALSEESNKAVKTRGRSLQWLQFATCHGSCYRMLENKDEQWEILQQIVDKVSWCHPQYTEGEIVDLLSQLINTTVGQSILQQFPELDGIMRNNENSFTNTLLIEYVSTPFFIPRHPWLMPLEKLSEARWQARNIINGNLLAVKRRRSGKFIEFEFEE